MGIYLFMPIFNFISCLGRGGWVLCLSLWLCGLSACDHDHETERPTVLRIGVLPDESSENLKSRYEVLAHYLEGELDMGCTLVIPASYEELVELFEQGEIDLAYFGGYTFIEAWRSAGAAPLVSRKRDLEFTSYFLVRSDHPATQLEQLGGQTLAFGSRHSTSGNLMPRYFLKEMGIDPESFFASVQYSDGHDETAYLVQRGEVEVGVANSQVIDAMLRDGRLSLERIRILWETPTYLDYTWASHPRLSAALFDQIRDAFLKLSIDDPIHAAVLKSLNATYYLPVEMGMFKDLEQVTKNLDFNKKRPR